MKNLASLRVKNFVPRYIKIFKNNNKNETTKTRKIIQLIEKFIFTTLLDNLENRILKNS